jgi:hypothetical protein
MSVVLRNAIVAVSLLMIATGCNNAYFERGTQVTIVDSGIPPSFKLSGSGTALRIFFYGPYNSIDTEEIKTKLGDPAIWELDAPRLSIESLPIIKYGVLPSGFTQIRPSSGLPPNLIEGKCYSITVPTNGANGGGIYFCIRNGKSEKVSDP